MLNARRHTGEATLKLDASIIDEFNDRGFICIPNIAERAELVLLRTMFDRLFAERAGRKEGMQYDMLGHDSEEGAPALPSIMNPINYAPELRHLRCRDNAAAIARQLLGPRATKLFEHVILKPARQGGATPWHQDEAYGFDLGFIHRRVGIWIPLQDVTPENGCMMFLPGSHRLGVLRHRAFGNDPRVHALECTDGFNHAEGVACPLSAGGATVHQGRTLHFAGPNRSDAPRYAYILAFDIPPERLPNRRDFSWNREKQAGNQARRRRWRMRGGIVIEAFRKLRSGAWRRPARLLSALRSVLRKLQMLVRQR
jgi:ectoine hydroxylase-related dioxygenase (phytanoyl-CoA dioxygenase family)